MRNLPESMMRQLTGLPPKPPPKGKKFDRYGDKADGPHEKPAEKPLSPEDQAWEDVKMATIAKYVADKAQEGLNEPVYSDLKGFMTGPPAAKKEPPKDTGGSTFKSFILLGLPPDKKEPPKEKVYDQPPGGGFYGYDPDLDPDADDEDESLEALDEEIIKEPFDLDPSLTFDDDEEED